MSGDNIDYLDQPPEVGCTITEIHMWIAIQDDGGEGIMSADVPFSMSDGSLTVRHIPLMSSSRDSAELLGPRARQVQQVARDHGGRLVRIELRSFRLVPN